MVKVTNNGLEQLARLVCGATTSTLFFHYMGIGCGSTAESINDTKLQQEMTLNGGARGIVDSHYLSAATKANWKKTFTFTGATEIKEVGIFTTASLTSATMYLRHKLGSTRTVANTDTVTFILTCTFT
jgi:hypothetical protein